MDLTGVPQFVRNADRFRHVVAVLARHGLADWLSTVTMPWLDRLFRAKAHRNVDDGAAYSCRDDGTGDYVLSSWDKS